MIAVTAIAFVAIAALWLGGVVYVWRKTRR
jgi:hypothetical protein